MWPLALVLFLVQSPDYTAEGLKALDQNNFQAAAEAFQKAVAADPRDYFAHFNLALADSALHKDADAIAEYRKTLELKPKLFEAELNAGILYMRQKDPASALPLLTDAAAQKSNDYRTRYFLAEAQLQTGDAADAQAGYALALTLDPKSAAAEMGLARALVAEGKLDDAAPHYRRAAQLQASYRPALLELAGLYEKNHQPEQALALYREFPDDAAAQQRVAALMVAANRYEDALPALEGAYAKDASEHNRLALAQAYLLAGHRDKALPLLQQCAAAEPGNFELRMAYGRALRDARQYAPAAAQFAAAAQIKPADPVPFREFGGMLYLIGDFPRALTAFDKARELGEDTPGVAFLRAIILDKQRQLKPAVEAYRQFLSASQGKNPDQEWQARQRVKLLERELEKR
ncbi:MAG TPA: tetratricopeptide repeat protein [Candidatus Limnocylindrales bacterium]|nr:tetratricopeptide repeat protein [Candidatus Limnocylindrales bacterium]